MSWLSRDIDDDAQAERLHRALSNSNRSGVPSGDPEVDCMLEVAQKLAPSVGMSESGRQTHKRAMLAAMARQHDRRSPTAGSRDTDGTGGAPLTYVVDPDRLGMLTLSDVEPIDAERAQQAADEIARLLALRGL